MSKRRYLIPSRTHHEIQLLYELCQQNPLGGEFSYKDFKKLCKIVQSIAGTMERICAPPLKDGGTNAGAVQD
jgi:hypothetical protein